MAKLLGPLLVGLAATVSELATAADVDAKAKVYFRGWHSTVIVANSVDSVRRGAPLVLVLRSAMDAKSLHRSLDVYRSQERRSQQHDTIQLVIDFALEGEGIEIVYATRFDLCFADGCVPLDSEFRERFSRLAETFHPVDGE